MIIVISVVLLTAFFAFFARLLIGPTLADRVVALDGMSVAGVAGIVAHAVHTGDSSFLPVAVLFTLVGFVGSSVVARFIEGRGE